jgi:hypothetical protein
MTSTHPLPSHELGRRNFGSGAAPNTCSLVWYSVETAAAYMRLRADIISRAAPHAAKVLAAVEEGFRDKLSKISCWMR